MVKIKFTRAARPVVGPLLTVVVVLVTFVFFVNGTSLLKEENIGRAIDIMVTPLAKGYVKNFSSNATVANVLQSISKKQIAESPEGSTLSDAEIDFLATQSARELALYIEMQTGFELQLSGTVVGNVHTFFSEKTESFSGSGVPMGLLILFAILLLLVKGLELILFIPLALLAYMLYELAIAFGLVTLQFETRSKEVINLI